MAHKMNQEGSLSRRLRSVAAHNGKNHHESVVLV